MQPQAEETREQREAREDAEEAKRRAHVPLCPNCKERPAQAHGWCDTCRE